MLIAIVLWIVLWRWRSWEILGSFCAILAVILLVAGYFSNAASPEFAGLPWSVVLFGTVVDVVLNVGIFAAVGALIVHFRGGKFEKKTSEAEIDAELARVRAEAAAREDSGRRDG